MRAGTRHGDRIAERALRARGPRRHRARPAPPGHRRRDLPVPGLRWRLDEGPRGDRHLVRLRRDALRPVGVPPRARARARTLRGVLPRGLHLRGDRPDARVVLHADGRGRAALRLHGLPDRGVPGSPRRPGRAQDVEVARQHRRRVRGDGSAGRRRAPLVPAHRRLAVVTAPGEHGDVRRRRPPVPVAAVERVRVLRHVRERERVRPVRRRRPPSSGGPCSTDGCSRSSRAPRRSLATASQAYDATGAGRRIAAFVEDLSNWYVRRARRRFWDPAGEGGDDVRAAFHTLHTCLVSRGPAARPVHPVRRGDPVAQPGRRSRRRAGLRAPVRLPDVGRASGGPDARRRDGRGPPDRRARPPGPHRNQDARPPAVAGGRRPLRRGPRRRSSRSWTWSPRS